MKKRITKTLSVILALIMLVSSTSVSGMGILSFAIDEFNEIDNLLASNEASDVRTELDSRTDTDDTRTDTDTGDDQVYEGTCGAEGDNLKWSFDSVTGELKITGSGKMYDYDYGYPDYDYAPWFSYTDSIKTVTIENGVTSIGDDAFHDCDSLKSITIPDSVTSIGSYAFGGCYSLQSVEIGSGVTSIGENAFWCCNSLEGITVDDNNDYYSNDSYGILYNKDKTTLVQYPIGNKRTSFDIPDSVTSIGGHSFEDCDRLKSITIPNTVTSIGDYAFSYNYRLKSITIPNSVTSIGDFAFCNCDRLKSITIQDSITSIGDYAFSDSYRLKSIEIGSGVTSIGESAFEGCRSLESITIPDSVTSIGAVAFDGCYSLESITVDDNNDYYSSDSYGVLYNKDKTTLLRYPIGNTRNSFDIPNSVTSIGNYAFDDCENLKSITIPDSVTSIGDDAFRSCDRLKSITIPNSVTSIGSDAFSYCDSLESVTIPNSVTSIGYGAFEYCDSLESITIPDSVTSIGDYAFEYCESLESVTIPSSVTSIGFSAFEDCYILENITILNPECEIYDSSYTFQYGTVIHGYANSTAQKYAEKYDRQFVVIDSGVEHTHTPREAVKENEIAATCSATGSYDMVVYCDVCEEEISRVTYTIDKLPHTESEWIIDDGYDCAKGGTKHTECTVCGEKMNTETISAKEHNYVKTVTPAACTQQGYTTYTCSECKNTYTADIVEPLGHSKDNGTVTKAATCTAAGTRTYKCSRCGEIINTETIPAAGHKSVVVKGKAATCTETGLTDGSKCSVCGTVLTAQKTVAKKAHTYKNVVTKATLTKNGKIVPTCSVCKATKTAATVYYPKTIKLSATSATYTGKAIKPKVNVTDSNGKAIAASNYTVSYKNNTKVGTATVTVTFKGNYSGTKTLTFKIVPGQVKNLKASKVTTTAVKLAWSKVTGAKYYKIEQSTDGKKWKTVKTTDKTTYTVSKLKTGAKYRFRVTALDSTKKIAGKASSVLKTGTKTAAPKVTLKSTKSKTATASWKKVTGASKYIVYKSINNKKWTKVGSTTKLSYKLSKLSGGKKIYVKVIAVNAYKQNSAYSKVASVTIKK